MAQASREPVVKLICGMLSWRQDVLDAAELLLAERFGAIDLRSETMAFDFTPYYQAEMGSPLLRRLVSFAPFATADVLASAKVATNELEARLAAERPAGGPARPANLDVGYVEPGKLVLASMKNHSSRVYLGQGVFGQVMLAIQKGRWRPLPWTFPDYASGQYFPFLDACREKLLRQGSEVTW